MENELVHCFDDWELRQDNDKGKHPVSEHPESDCEFDQGDVAPSAGPSSGSDGAGGDGSDRRAAAAAEAADKGEAAASQSPCESEPGDMICAICLNSIPLENLAMVKDCDHMYCTTCILHWALHKEEPWCPQCKQPFSYLLTYRALDGELQDFPCEEPVSLLKRARWFEEHLRFADQASVSLIEESRLADQMAWQDYAGDYDLAEDEELESFYFSSAAGRARVVLGNRRYGEGGFISAGRRQARPVVERKRGNKMGKSREHAVVGMPPVPPTTAAFHTPNAGGGRKADSGARTTGGGGLGAGGSASTPVPFSNGADFYDSSAGSAAGSAIYGSSPSGSGRRARRNARRAALDAGIEAAGSWGNHDSPAAAPGQPA